MSSVESLREFINQRLTAAAEEIFTEVEKTIVQYEEEIDRQRRLLEITWRPQIKLQRTGRRPLLMAGCTEEDVKHDCTDVGNLCSVCKNSKEPFCCSLYRRS